VDLAKEEQVKGIFEGLDVVIHLAAFIWQDPPFVPWDKIADNNLRATYNVLQECVRAGVKRVIFSSTNHTQHGLTCDTQLNEILHRERLGGRKMQLSDPAFPDSLYGLSKLCCEDLGKLFALHHKLEFISFRIGWIRLRDEPSDYKDKPEEEFMRAMFLSHRDLVGFFRTAIELPEVKTGNGIPWMNCYAISNNDKAIFDLETTIATLGYVPQDNAETFFGEV